MQVRIYGTFNRRGLRPRNRFGFSCRSRRKQNIRVIVWIAISCIKLITIAEELLPSQIAVSQFNRRFFPAGKVQSPLVRSRQPPLHITATVSQHGGYSLV